VPEACKVAELRARTRQPRDAQHRGKRCASSLCCWACRDSTSGTTHQQKLPCSSSICQTETGWCTERQSGQVGGGGPSAVAAMHCTRQLSMSLLRLMHAAHGKHAHTVHDIWCHTDAAAVAPFSWCSKQLLLQESSKQAAKQPSKQPSKHAAASNRVVRASQDSTPAYMHFLQSLLQMPLCRAGRCRGTG
jgi:hypothetical protein